MQPGAYTTIDGHTGLASHLQQQPSNTVHDNTVHDNPTYTTIDGHTAAVSRLQQPGNIVHDNPTYYSRIASLVDPLSPTGTELTYCTPEIPREQYYNVQGKHDLYYNSPHPVDRIEEYDEIGTQNIIPVSGDGIFIQGNTAYSQTHQEQDRPVSDEYDYVTQQF